MTEPTTTLCDLTRNLARRKLSRYSPEVGKHNKMFIVIALVASLFVHMVVGQRTNGYYQIEPGRPLNSNNFSGDGPHFVEG